MTSLIGRRPAAGSAQSPHELPLPAPAALSSPGRYLRWLVRRQRRPILLSISFGMVTTVAQALIPLSIGAAIDKGLTAGSWRSLVGFAGAVLGLSMVQAVTGMLRDRHASLAALAASFSTTRLVGRQATRLGSALADGISRGEALTVGMADVTQISRLVEILAHAGGAMVAVVAVAVIMLTVSWQLGLVVLVGVPLVLVTTAMIVKPLHRRQHGLRGLQPRLTTRIADIVRGLRVIRGLGAEAHFAGRYRADSWRVRDAGVHVAEAESTLHAIQSLLPGLLLALVAWIGAGFLSAGAISAGQLVAFCTYAVFLQSPLRLLTTANTRLTKGRVAAGQVIRFLSAQPRETASAAASVTLPDTGDLVDPLSGLSARATAFTAVVCADPDDSGALAMRLGGYADSPVTLGGVRLRDAAADEVRRRILVGDDTAFIFSGRLREQIDPLDRSSQAEHVLHRSIEAAMLQDVVDELPLGLDDEILTSGTDFSGGQQQRIRLARALTVDPEILILVDPTSALDVHTEAAVAQRLHEARDGRTSIVFSTSPFLLELADEVVYVQHGRAVLSGPHEALLKDGRYQATIARNEDGE